MKLEKSVDQFIDAAPVDMRSVLRKVRAAIKEAAPGADEGMSYGMPFYSHGGEVGVQARLCYFRAEGTSLRMYFLPRDLEPHRNQIAKYQRTNSALHFPMDRPIPIALIQSLVRDAVRRHQAGTTK